MQLCSFCCPFKFRCCQGQIIIKVWNHHAWSSPKISSHWASLYKLHLLDLLCSVRLCRFSGGDSRLLPMQQEGPCCGAVIALWYSSLQDPGVFGSHCRFFSHSRSPSFSSPVLHSNITCPVLWSLSSLVSLPMVFELSLGDGTPLGTVTMALLMVLHHGRKNTGINWKSMIEVIPNFRQAGSLIQCLHFSFVLALMLIQE